MPVLSGIALTLALLAYAAGAVFASVYLRNGESRFLTSGKRLAASGNVFLLVLLVLRWYEWRLIPFSGLDNSLYLFLIFCTGIVLSVQREESLKPLLAFYLPALGLLAAVIAYVGFQNLRVPPMDNLNGALLTIHVGLVFLAMAHFFVASLTSFVYVFQAQRLKRRKTTGMAQRLPSLEQLDKTLFHLITIGYPIFLVTIGFGVAWAINNPELLPPQWYLAPKYFFTAFTLVLFAASFYIRRAGLLRGPKLAYLLFVGFTLLLAGWIVLEFVNRDLYATVEASI
jgi:ABC-type transport system involved in cytochrome c biogenesis permease subunit